MKNKKKGHKFLIQPVDGKPVPIDEIKDSNQRYVLYSRIFVGDMNECLNLMNQLTRTTKINMTVQIEQE